ncbi:gamma carbonic anhydrase family protein [Corynebacterium tuscaniense]|uniref:gamma carbonic anhydrase family protein n=1 Tax=Corynebacterium tuscaniense TaxID=302449 RepID=UPI00050DB0EF|nr:gamma carbonic anhydrase family protein [Corynebacterium tuscaniense]KGF23458.1 acetyltransferase [Corynebacterium tuscaniense DNF00037]
MLYSFEGAHPVIHPTAFVAKEATIIGNVTIGPDAAIFPGVVIRGDVGAIHIGARTNVQDGSVIHVQTDTENVIGEDVTIGHLAMVHGERIGNGTLIGMGATVLAYSTIGAGCIIGGGAVVLEGQEIPDASLAAGVPAKIRRDVSADERAGLITHAAKYVALGRRHREGLAEYQV